MLDETQKQQIAEILFKKYQGFLYPARLVQYIGYDEQDWLDFLDKESVDHNKEIDEKIAQLENEKI